MAHVIRQAGDEGAATSTDAQPHQEDTIQDTPRPRRDDLLHVDIYLQLDFREIFPLAALTAVTTGRR